MANLYSCSEIAGALVEPAVNPKKVMLLVSNLLTALNEVAIQFNEFATSSYISRCPDFL